MASVVLKKRKFTDIVHSQNEISAPKMFLTPEGNFRRNNNSYFNELENMFPTFTKHEIEKVFNESNQDAILAMDKLKEKRRLRESLKSLQNSENRSENPALSNEAMSMITAVVDELPSCQSPAEAQSLLGNMFLYFKKQGIEEFKKMEADNQIMKRAFQVQQEIIVKQKMTIEGGEKQVMDLQKKVNFLETLLRKKDLENRNSYLRFNTDIY